MSDSRKARNDGINNKDRTKNLTSLRGGYDEVICWLGTQDLKIASLPLAMTESIAMTTQKT
ncbi:hypothetical protein TOREUM_10023 [Tenacibaculum litoreum]